MFGQASSSRQLVSSKTTEFDILKSSHKFLREDDDPDTSTNTSWEERLAQKYYSSLYREFAMCDLKHYKSGNFALRWRTEEEVLSGAGEETCSNTRCPLHDPNASPKPSGLKTVELPFAYEEHGQRKSALVKVVLCDSCLKKLMYKREKERKKKEKTMIEGNQKGEKIEGEQNGTTFDEMRHHLETENDEERGHRRPRERPAEQSRKRKKSRSCSSSPPHKQKRKRKHEHEHRRHESSS